MAETEIIQAVDGETQARGEHPTAVRESGAPGAGGESAVIRNLTPHPVNFLDADGHTVRVITPSGPPARAQTTQTDLGEIAGIPVTRTVYGAPEGLPDPQPGVYLVVATLTIQAARAAGRTTEDLYAPGELVRDDQGRIVGCRGLTTL